METMEIVLLIVGGIIFILSFFIPEKKGSVSGQTRELAKEEIAELVNREMVSVRGHVDDVVDEAVTYAMEKTERSLERLSNEKIMAVSEYSDTVLAEIHKNHEEAMFLYDMLNSKHVNLKNTVSEVNRTVKEAEETVTSFQRLTPEAVNEAKVQKPVPKTAPKNAGSGADKPQKEPKQRKTEAADEQERAGRVSFLQETDADGRNSNERILELYKQGKSKVAIAKELGLGVGEVKLVIDLFNNQ